MIHVTSDVKIHALNGDLDVGVGPESNIQIHSHWKEDRLIEIHIGKDKYVFMAGDVIEAVRNATNSNRME